MLLETHVANFKHAMQGALKLARELCSLEGKLEAN